MSKYLDFEIETDPEIVAQLAYDEMAFRLPGWDPIVGEIDTTIIQAIARVAVEIRASAGIVPLGVFRYLAQALGFVPAVGAQATATVNFLFNDTDPHTIPAGTQMVITDGLGVTHGFQTLFDIVENDGDGEFTDVTVQAVDVGSDFNFENLGTSVVLSNALSYVASITQTTDSSGGVDSQDDQQFLDSLIARYQLLSSAPILPRDFSIAALQVGAGAARAVTIDGYDLVAATGGHERTVTIFVVDATGAVLSSPAKADIEFALQQQREVNFLVYVGDPAINDISVLYTAHALPGFDPASVHADVDAALAAYLSPATWGTPAYDDSTGWTTAEGWDKVRRGELFQVINLVPGLAYVDTLFLKAGAVLPTTEVADITLTGVAPLARLANISGTVAAA